MSEADSPGETEILELSCGESIHPHDIDLGMRELACACGSNHAVVTDAHPLARFVPEEFVAVLRETTDTDDAFETFSTPHALAMVREEFPEAVAMEDCSDDGQVGYALVWVTDFPPTRLHEIIVELLVELMDHAISHAADDDAIQAFESDLERFDVTEFVEDYRRERDFDSEYDTPV